nr:hypothetical protein [Tanacetum cinerariifolium]
MVQFNLKETMASADNTSGPTLQRKERCMLQCALSLEKEKFSYLRPFSSTSFTLFHARSVINLGLVQNLVSPTPYVPPSKKDYEILFQELFDEYFTPSPHAVSLVSVAIAATRAVDPAGLPSSTTIDQDVPSASKTMADINLNVNAPAEQAPAMIPPTHILKHTNFFRAFTASSTIPSIYIQQFWDTIRYDRDNVRCICKLDEQWFDLTKETLRDAIQITPVNNNLFSFPPTPDALINFVNNLGYPKVVITLSTVEYLEKVAKHQRYLADEEGSDPDSPVPKPAKATKKSKPSAPKAAPVIKHDAAKASKSTSSQQPKPKLAPAKTQEKKRKLVTKTSDDLSPAKSSKPGLVTKRRKPTRSLSLVDEFVDEGIPEKEPTFDDEEADMQRAVEESLKSVHYAHPGLLPPVVFREPDSGKFQLLPEVQGKGKEKVSDKQVALDLLTLQTLKKDVPHVVRIGAQDEGQAGLNPGVQIEGQAGSNLGDDAEPQSQSSPVVHVEPNLKHVDLEATDVILEDPASSIETLSSLQHLAKEFSFGDQFFNDKPSGAENEKTTAKIKAESMVSDTIHQDTSGIPPMTSPVIDLISRPDSPNDYRPLPATATATTTTTITTLPLPPQP